MAKTIWARISMSLEVSDEEYEKLKKDNNDDIEFDSDSELAERFLKDGWLDGVSYIPDGYLL